MQIPSRIEQDVTDSRTESTFWAAGVSYLASGKRTVIIFCRFPRARSYSVPKKDWDRVSELEVFLLGSTTVLLLFVGKQR